MKLMWMRGSSASSYQETESSEEEEREAREYSKFEVDRNLLIQVSIVIRGRYVTSFWTANTELADKNSIFD